MSKNVSIPTIFIPDTTTGILTVTGDWHIRKDIPICRPETEDEWMACQLEKVEKVFLSALAYGSGKVLHTGDLYHRSQPYHGVIGKLNNLLQRVQETGRTQHKKELAFFGIVGNHDLPYNTMENFVNSGWNLTGIYRASEVWKGALDFGGKVRKGSTPEIVVTHQLVVEKKGDIIELATHKTAQQLLDEYPSAKWIFTGDYHGLFTYEQGGRHVINPGCLIRQSINEKDYQCGFYQVNLGTEKVEFISVEDAVELDSHHLLKIQEKEKDVLAFIEKINTTGKGTFSFVENLQNKLQSKDVPAGARKIIQDLMEEIS